MRTQFVGSRCKDKVLNILVQYGDIEIIYKNVQILKFCQVRGTGLKMFALVWVPSPTL